MSFVRNVKTLKIKKLAHILPIQVEVPFDRMVIYVLGPFPETNRGNKYVAVMFYCYNKWPERFFFFFFFFSICLDDPHLTNEHRTQDCIAS